VKIHDDHLYHGSALIQIAEHRQFTSINSFTIKGAVLHNVFRINESIGVYLKYSSKPKGKYKEYQFTFTAEHLDILQTVSGVASKLVVAMVCVADREICALGYPALAQLIAHRKLEAGSDEDQYGVLLTLPKDSAFRAYVNPPGTKGKMLGGIKIARNRFPSSLFN